MPQDHVWLSTYKPYEPLSYQMLGNAIVTLSDKAKVPFSLHDGRRWINTALEGIGISPNWARKIRGRKVRGEEAPYSQPQIEQLRAKFKEAVPLLEFTSETSPAVEDRLKALEAFKKTLTPEQLELAKRGDMRFSRKKAKEKTEPCKDGEHCENFKQIQEADLLSYLQQGWEIVKELQSGEVIVKRG